MKNLLIIFVSIFLFSSCASNTFKEIPGEVNTFNIKGTPAYILVDDNPNISLIESDVLFCQTKLEDKNSPAKRLLKRVGGAYGLGGLIVAVDLSTTGGIVTRLLVLPYSMIAMATWTLYASADALSELGSYKGLEVCLEKKGYDIVFYVESND